MTVGRLPRFVAALAVTLLAASHAASAPGVVFRVSNRAEIPLHEMVEDLKTARVVFMGEEHDNRAHHAAQLTVIQALAQAGAKVAVGLEMFRADAQADLDRWVAGRLGQRQLYEVYADNWARRLWPLYSDIFFYALQERIPLVGLNVPRALVAQVAREGFDALAREDKDALGVVQCDVDERYQQLIALVLGRKDQESEAFGRFCEAQVVWDTAMAQNALRFLEANPERVLVVLAGTFHAWKHGIPEQLRRLSPLLPYRVILPSSDKSFLRYDIVLQDADYVWWHE